MNECIDFLKKHRILLIGFVLYTIVFLLSCRFPQWLDYDAYAKIGSDNLTTHLPRLAQLRKEQMMEEATGGYLDLLSASLPHNRFLAVFPLNFLYVGIDEIAAAFNFNIGIVISLITYCALLIQWGLEKLYAATKEDLQAKEKSVILFFISSAAIYPLCFLIRSLDRIDWFGWHNHVLSGGNNALILLATLVIILGFVFLGLPYILSFLHYFLYMFAFILLGAGIRFIDQKPLTAVFGSAQLPREIITFLLTIALTVIAAIQLEKLYQFGLKFALFPARLVILPFQKLGGKIKSLRKSQ